MNEKQIDDQLRHFEKQHGDNWQRLIYKLRRHLDDWGHKNVRNPFWKMKLSCLPVIFNISVDGSSAAEISRQSLVIKQSLSRTIKEMEVKEMVYSKTSKRDKRSELLKLTLPGKKIVLNAHYELEKLTQEYVNLVGEKNLQIATDVIIKIINYHESLNEANEEMEPF